MDLEAVSRMLAEAGCVSPREEAGLLMEASDGDPALLGNLLARRKRGEPLEWLTGRVTFCGLDLFIAPGVYVPRPQTEPLAERAAGLLPPSGLGVDLCTGTGAIAAVMDAAAPESRVLATDLDPVAVACARRNGVEVFQGFLDDSLPPELEHRVDVLTAVAPYVPTDLMRLLPRDVRAFEPRMALDGGPDGTDLMRQVARRSADWLKPGGWLLLELGGDQAETMDRLLAGLGFEAVEVMTDEDGDARAICAQLRPPPATT